MSYKKVHIHLLNDVITYEAAKDYELEIRTSDGFLIIHEFKTLPYEGKNVAVFVPQNVYGVVFTEGD